MDEVYFTLDEDDDVLRFQDDAFTVSKVKAIIAENVREKICTPQGRRPHIIFFTLKEDNEIENKVRLPLTNSLWISITEPIDCKVLRLGYSGWKSGKLKIKTSIDLCPLDPDFLYSSVEVQLLFYPEISEKNEPENIESPLDDIRQSESYQKLL